MRVLSTRTALPFGKELGYERGARGGEASRENRDDREQRRNVKAESQRRESIRVEYKLCANWTNMGPIDNAPKERAIA